MLRYWFISFLALYGSLSFGANLPGGLSHADINRVAGILGAGASARLARSAEAYPLFPGIKLGMELSFFPSDDINFLGDKRGSLPSLNPLPRLYLAKSILPQVEVILNYIPATLENLIATYGGLLKWSFVREKDSWVEGALYGGYTRISTYHGEFTGDSVEVGIAFSRDYVRLKPYLGTGLIFSSGNIIPPLSLNGRTDGANTTAHVFFGSEVELPLNVSFQLDLLGISPQNVSVGSSVFIGKKF